MTTEPGHSPKNVPHILALGGGYATVFLYKKLAPLIRQKKVQMTVVDKNNYHCFHGLVPEMLVGKIQPSTPLSPMRTLFRGAQFRNGDIEAIDLPNKEVLFSRGLDGKQFRINYDHLVLDLGSVENLNLYPGMAAHTLRLKAFPDILRARHHLITMLELADIERDPVEVTRLLNFVVAGGNYAGVEVAGELADFLPRISRQRFPNIPVEQIKVTLVHSGAKILPELGVQFPELQKYAQEALAASPYVRLALNVRLASATTEEAILNSGERISTRTIINCTGASSSPLLDTLPFERVGGRVLTDEFCRVKGSESVWAGGDCSAIPRQDGTYCPPLAVWAMNAGRQIAINIEAIYAGRPLEPYRFAGLGDACTIGGWRAAAHLHGVPVRGLIAYLAWRVFMLLYLPAPEKKVRLFFDWLTASIFGWDVINMNLSRPVSVASVMYEPGQEIVREGEVGRSMFVIRTGEVEVLKTPPGGGPAEPEARLGPGDQFGEIAVFQRIRRTATVRAVTRVELLHVGRDAAVALSESNVEIGEALNPASADGAPGVSDIKELK